MTSNERKIGILFLNSFVAYLLAYFLILIPSQLITHFSAQSFDIPTKFEYFKIDFPIADFSTLWNQNSIIGTYIAAPAFCLIFAVFCLRFIRLFSYQSENSLILLTIWLYAHAVNMVLGGLVVGIPLVKGIGFVTSWLYFPAAFTWFIVIVACIALFVNGLIIRSSFISLVYSQHFLTNRYNAFAFKIPAILLPAILGNVLFLFANIPDNSLYEKLLLVTMFFQIFGAFQFKYQYFDINEKRTIVRFNWKMLLYLILTFGVLLVWKLLHNAFFSS